MRTIILLSLTVGLAHAAPSTLLESEFFIPLESQPTQFALADVVNGLNDA